MAEVRCNTHLLDLPDEVIVQCFSSLDFPSILNISLSCKRLHRFSKYDEVWKGVYFHVWPCKNDVASHPVVQRVLHCNSWYESARYRRRLYQRLSHMMSYPSFRFELDHGKYSKYAHNISVESLVALILCIGAFGVPGVGDGCTWGEHQGLAVGYAAENFNMKTRVDDVLEELFVNTTAFDDKESGVLDFVRYTDWAKHFNSSDIYGVLWNTGWLRLHPMVIERHPQREGAISLGHVNDRMGQSHPLYGLIACTLKQPASFMCGGHEYAFSNSSAGSNGPFIIDRKDSTIEKRAATCQLV
ncbi:uncharacterized protein LOC134180258 [Corticium candelabrum]|uniref:uncharacterized protein LOC134180258 n=1 Tax=Corticium candelabrum TaxID=121492 RepID=UPI002E2725B1|nr:uncharacterized protein LOC134180258 [Corticium candelabrum]